MKTIQKYYASAISSFQIIALLLVLLLFLGSCQKSANTEPEPQSAVNIINATIGVPPMAFFINKFKVEGPIIKYGEESGYFITFPGVRDFDIFADVISDYILRTNFSFKQNTYHSIFIVGEGSSISAVFTDDDLSNPSTGKAKVRFVHLSPDTESLVLALKNGATIFPGQTYKTASQFVTIEPGVYDLQLKTITGAVLLEKNVTITAGKIYDTWCNGMKTGISNSPLELHFKAID